jgi:sugar/nucleoside kinase (ribokinase family)
MDITYIGTALVDSIIKGFDPKPVSASGYRAASGSLNVGGEAVNGSIAAAKLGLSTQILCYLGEDPAGDMVISELSKAGVDTSAVVRRRDHSTPVTTMFVREDGTRQSITNLSHRYNFRPDLYPETLAGSRIVILGSLFRAPFDDPEVVYNVVSAAHDCGALVLADTKIPNFNKISLEDLRYSLPLIDYIFPNEDEARYHSGMDDPEDMADVFLFYGVKNAIVKLGSKGCIFKNAHERIRLDAIKVESLDSTGAGDNFIAGFAAELLRGADHRQALTFANACGAICCTAVGSSGALTGRAQVEALLAGSPLR